MKNIDKQIKQSTQIQQKVHIQIKRLTPHRLRSLTHQRKFIPTIRSRKLFKKQNKQSGSLQVRWKSQQNQKLNSGGQLSRTNTLELFNKGKLYFQDNKMDDAINIFKQLLNKQNNNPEILYFLGSAFLNKQKYQTCIFYINELIAKMPTFSKNAYLLLSISFKKLKQFKIALKTLIQAINLFPNFQEAYFYAGKLQMKLKQFSLAQQLFNKVIELNPQNPLYLIGKADCLRKQGSRKQAIDLYTKALKLEGGRYRLVCLIKRMSAYFQEKLLKQAEKDINQLIQNQIESSEVYYFKGAILTRQGNPQEASIYYELTLMTNNHNKAVTRAFEALIRYKIQQKDFYEAYHQLGRLPNLQIDREYLSNLICFIQGVTECIKHRPNEGLRKLEQLNNRLERGFSFQKKNYPYQQVITPLIYSYLGFCYFSKGQHKKALKYLDKSSYNKAICQGIVFHKQHKFKEASRKFQEAKTIGEIRVQPYFYKALNYIKQFFVTSNQALLEYALFELRAGENIKTNNSLFYFYYQLVLLFKNQPSLFIILKAIEKSDDNVSQYYFIKGLIYATSGEFDEAISDFTNALSIDNTICDFFKQRSKCYYFLNKYQEALIDIRRCLQIKQQDYESKLLLSFYLYAYDKYELALQFLIQTAEDQVSHSKLTNFFYCLYFRLRLYEKAGLIGQLILNIAYGKKNESIITQKQTQSQIVLGEFDNIGLDILKGAYSFHKQDWDSSLVYFYGALCLIKQSLGQRQDFDYNVELRIFELKFNIIIVNIKKGDFSQALNLIQILEEDIQMKSLAEALSIFEEYLKYQINPSTNQLKQIKFLDVLPFNEKKLLSSQFPFIYFEVKNFKIRTRLIVHHPQKIKFNIKPQFNPDILKNFDISKIEDKPEPPWVKRQQKAICFTSKILTGQQLEIVDTQRNTPIINEQPMNTKAKLRLNASVEQKLKKIFQKKK